MAINHQKLSKDLRGNILAVIAGTSTREQLNGLIAVCHSLASAFLASKSTISALTKVHGLCTADLAFDCIAELFQQDANGNYIQLQSYFTGLLLPTAREEEILSHLRRLVFSKVNHGVYRLYSESDPALAKTLRNIKIAVQSLGHFIEVERFGESCIAPSLCETREQLPAFERDELEKTFLPATTGNEHVPEFLAKLSRFLREQEEHCRIIPLVTIGLLVREAYVQKHNTNDDVIVHDDNLIESDTLAIIKQTCHDIRKQTEEKYVRRDDVQEEIFVHYFTAIEGIVAEKFIGKNGYDGSLFESLQQLIPELTKEEYTSIHRNRIEYLLKLVEKRARKRLRNM